MGAKKTVYGVKILWLPGKEKVLPKAGSNEGYAVFWDMKWLISIDFFERDATAKIASYCQLQRQK